MNSYMPIRHLFYTLVKHAALTDDIFRGRNFIMDSKSRVLHRYVRFKVHIQNMSHRYVAILRRIVQARTTEFFQDKKVISFCSIRQLKECVQSKL